MSSRSTDLEDCAIHSRLTCISDMTTHGKTSAMLATRNLQHDLSQLVPIHVAYPSIRVWGPGTRSYLEVRGLRRRNSRLHTGAFFKGWPKDRPVKGPTKRPGSFQNSEKGRCRRDGFGSSWKTISRCVCVCVCWRPPRETSQVDPGGLELRPSKGRRL